MKKIVLLLVMLIFCGAVRAEDFDYAQIYRDLPVPDVKYIHDIDPGEYMIRKILLGLRIRCSGLSRHCFLKRLR